MNEPIELYKLRKLIYYIIFNSCIEDYEESNDMFDIVILESLRNIVEFHVGRGDLSKDVKNNINNFLRLARDINDENRNERIKICNEIIRIINSNDLDKSILFYRLELQKRTRDFGYIIKYSDDKVIEDIELVHDSICDDFFIMTSHTDNIEEEIFKTEFLPNFINSDAYYDSLNAILEENPSVFKNETFYNRMLQVLNLNKEIYNNDKKITKYNKKLINKINRKRK